MHRDLIPLLHGLYVLCAWEWVLRDWGGEAERGKSPNKTFKFNSFDGAAVRGQLRWFCCISEAAEFSCPLLIRKHISMARLFSGQSLLPAWQTLVLNSHTTTADASFSPFLWPHLPPSLPNMAQQNHFLTGANRTAQTNPISFVRKLRNSAQMFSEQNTPPGSSCTPALLSFDPAGPSFKPPSHFPRALVKSAAEVTLAGVTGQQINDHRQGQESAPAALCGFTAAAAGEGWNCFTLHVLQHTLKVFQSFFQNK